MEEARRDDGIKEKGRMKQERQNNEYKENEDGGGWSGNVTALG